MAKEISEMPGPHPAMMDHWQSDKRDLFPFFKALRVVKLMELIELTSVYGGIVFSEVAKSSIVIFFAVLTALHYAVAETMRG
ncbi:MAG: hypothetical protein AB2535_22135 [Candidatus Thiodiazotropha endolucinida]